MGRKVEAFFLDGMVEIKASYFAFNAEVFVGYKVVKVFIAVEVLVANSLVYFIKALYFEIFSWSFAKIMLKLTKRFF